MRILDALRLPLFPLKAYRYPSATPLTFSPWRSWLSLEPMSRSWIAIFVFCCWTIAGRLAPASPIYQISFSGTISSGTLTDLKKDNTFYSADLTGLPITGTLTFDFGQAPPPMITNNGTFITTSITGDNGPVFITEQVVLPTLLVPADALPVPTTFALVREAPPLGATIVNPSIDHQLLSFSTEPNGSAQTILEGLQFFDDWNTADVSVDRNIDVALGLSSNVQFLPATGGVPASWTLSNSTIGSTFAFVDFFHNLQSPDPILHGVTTDYTISGTFVVNQASGAFVVPEPASIRMMALVLGPAVIILALRKLRVSAWRPFELVTLGFLQDVNLASGPFHLGHQSEPGITRDRERSVPQYRTQAQSGDPACFTRG